ncbi:28S ribosomal protein S11, mitochondrial [Dufourea novaeangliae]|uniref:28S ribosomal protein S11, mitochondrial n=1 Tax=Dufourea novaeangliae TaxID=178035 RepID=A0A154PGC4_DUFNO|nr:28S ribosomal protein S11, mitochondrial [Dufourea novaeangliae]
MITSTLRSAACSLMKTKIDIIERMKKISCPSAMHVRCIHITSAVLKEIRLNNKEKLRVKRTKFHEPMEGEHTVGVNISPIQSPDFPNEFTPHQMFNSVPFEKLPIINIKATPNNTIFSTTRNGILLHSSGIEGFKNAKKGTNIAAQQAAMTLGTRTIEKGIKTVRVRVQGIGPGRLSSIKGLQLAGLQIVSITDDTRVSWNPPRPRKQRRI